MEVPTKHARVIPHKLGHWVRNRDPSCQVELRADGIHAGGSIDVLKGIKYRVALFQHISIDLVATPNINA